MVNEFTYLVPLFPLLAFAAIVLFTRRNHKLSANIAIIGIGLSFFVALGILIEALAEGASLAQNPFYNPGITWYEYGNTAFHMGWLVDPLAVHGCSVAASQVVQHVLAVLATQLGVVARDCLAGQHDIVIRVATDSRHRTLQQEDTTVCVPALLHELGLVQDRAQQVGRRLQQGVPGRDALPQRQRVGVGKQQDALVALAARGQREQRAQIVGGEGVGVAAGACVDGVCAAASVVGWSWILSNLKTIIETGHPLPSIM